jgi:hypothetical protein
MSDLPSRLLYRERYVVAVRSQHPLAGRGAMTIDGFCSYDHILVSPTGGSFEGPTDQALARLRRRRVVRYSVPSFLLMLELLLTDDLVALVPSRLRENNKRLSVLKPPVDVPGFDVIAVWHPRLDKDVAHQWCVVAWRKPLSPRGWSNAACIAAMDCTNGAVPPKAVMPPRLRIIGWSLWVRAAPGTSVGNLPVESRRRRQQTTSLLVTLRRHRRSREC